MSRRAFTVVAIVVAAGALVFLAIGGLGDNLVYYWSPTELATSGPSGAVVRLGGQVKDKSIERRGGSEIDFVVTDGAHDIKVHSRAVPPQMFREGIGVVIEGVLGPDGVFESERIMVKHGNEYQAPKPGEKPPMLEGAGT